jgi:hypothetical protein
MVLAVCVLLLFGMLELSLALVRHSVLSEVARRVARAAIVHGDRSEPMQDTWGPASLSVSAADDHPAAAAARLVLMTIDPADVELELSWPDEGNQAGQHVRVAARFTHRPIVPVPGWYDELNLHAVSTMQIAH